MTKEQIDAIEQLYIERSDSLDASSYSIPELLAAARRALDLEEALEYSSHDECLLNKEEDGTYTFSILMGTKQISVNSETPLEAINNARRNHGG